MLMADRQTRETLANERPRENDTAYRTTASLAPPRSLHYAAAPLGIGDVRGGITAAENAAVHRLSAGRVDLHAIGATISSVRTADPRLRAVGARSLTQGRQALIGDAADRGHEMWHLAQQAMGQVSRTGRIGGQPVNTSARLETEADRMGAALARQVPMSAAFSSAPPTVSHDPVGGGDASMPIQRRVSSFAAITGQRLPPIAHLIKSLKYDNFVDSRATVKTRIDSYTKNAKKTATIIPNEIIAKIEPNGPKDKKMERKKYKSGVVGKIGIDDYFLRAGKREIFEGGHLIPHELWADTDPQAKFADDYANLVPMSRTMNVGDSLNTWRSQETKMIELFNNKTAFTVNIGIERPEYETHKYSRLGEIFNLGIKMGVGDETVKINNWLPNKFNIYEYNGLFPSYTAYESEIFNVHKKIVDGSELVEVLKQSVIWNRCDPDLQEELINL